MSSQRNFLNSEGSWLFQKALFLPPAIEAGGCRTDGDVETRSRPDSAIGSPPTPLFAPPVVGSALWSSVFDPHRGLTTYSSRCGFSSAANAAAPQQQPIQCRRGASRTARGRRRR